MKSKSTSSRRKAAGHFKIDLVLVKKKRKVKKEKKYPKNNTIHTREVKT